MDQANELLSFAPSNLFVSVFLQHNIFLDVKELEKSLRASTESFSQSCLFFEDIGECIRIPFRRILVEFVPTHSSRRLT
jgi:hypothetical protein